MGLFPWVEQTINNHLKLTFGNVPRWSLTTTGSSARNVPNTNCQHSLSKTAAPKQEVGVIWEIRPRLKRFKAKRDARRRFVAFKTRFQTAQQATCTSLAAADRPLNQSAFGSQVRDWMYFLHMGGNCNHKNTFFYSVYQGARGAPEAKPWAQSVDLSLVTGTCKRQNNSRATGQQCFKA